MILYIYIYKNGYISLTVLYKKINIGILGIVVDQTKGKVNYHKLEIRSNFYIN